MYKFIATVVVIVTGFAVFMTIGYFSNQPVYAGGISKFDARSKCEDLIKGMSVNPSTVVIDRGTDTDTRSGESVQFDWDSTQLQMQNGFGAMIGSTATCTVNLRTGHIDNLRVI